MKKFKLWGLSVALAALALAGSCAKEVSEDPSATQKRIFESYIRANGYDRAEMIGDSLYVISRTGTPTGEAPQDSTYAFVKYSACYTSGEYAAYNVDSIAMKLGTYRPSNFYGDFVWPVKMGQISDPLSDIVKNMKPGEKTVTIVPPWLSNYNATHAFSSTSSIIKYEIELKNVVDDIMKYQQDQLAEFSRKHFEGMDTISRGFYCKTFHKSAETDTLTEGTSIRVRYVGRMLDGTVFDTNIEDTAKKYDMYDPANTYDHLTVLYYVNDPEKMADENSFVLGFCKALTTGVTWGDKCFAFFDSDYGYGSSGNLSDGAGIPPYYPITFELWLEEE